MNYNLLEPPFNIKPFREMNKSEAQIHFDWYIQQIPKRIQMLSDAFELTGGGNKEDLDYSPESLVKVWNWFIQNAEILRKTKEEIALETKSLPILARNDISTNKISTGWLSVAMDIALYFAKCIIYNYDQIKWGILTKPKDLAYVNKPVLMGFKAKIELDVSGVINNQVIKVVNGEKNPNTLLGLYKTWVGWI